MSPSLVESVEALDPAVVSALRRLVVGLADSKRILGIRYSDWLLGAPSVETAIAASAMAQDEWGHARLLYSMLKDFGEDPMVLEHERAAGSYASMDALDEAFDDWAAVVAAMVVADGALTTALEGFGEGRYGAARGRVPKMVSEEEFHGDMGGAWFRRLSGGSAEARERLGAAVDAMLPRTLTWLAPDDEAHGTLAEAGLTLPATELRGRFEERVASVLDALEIDVSGVDAEREGWDEARGRGPGHPTEDAVERARGDRNRELFVE